MFMSHCSATRRLLTTDHLILNPWSSDEDDTCPQFENHIRLSTGEIAFIYGHFETTLAIDVAAVAGWYRYRIVARLVTSSSPVPLKTRRVGQRCTLNLSRAETSSRWCGVVVTRGGRQLRCRPRHLTMVQNYVIRRQKPSCS
ncbi:uncharacterized protein TNCV_3637061 [Trichonephila clavipes]|nr:uncharacterized protein TNCV_3637061 [Trichonephila clavipes]